MTRQGAGNHSGARGPRCSRDAQAATKRIASEVPGHGQMYVIQVRRHIAEDTRHTSKSPTPALLRIVIEIGWCPAQNRRPGREGRRVEKSLTARGAESLRLNKKKKYARPHSWQVRLHSLIGRSSAVSEAAIPTPPIVLMP